MTKAFLHGRTEAVRTVQTESIHFVKARTQSLTVVAQTQLIIITVCHS